MYEIWLVLNILWEMALGVWPLLAGAALLWVALLVLAARRGGAWRAALPWTTAVGLVAAAAAFLLLPAWSRSSLSEMGYWVDWANLAAMAGGVGTAVAVFVWPLLAMRRRSPAH